VPRPELGGSDTPLGYSTLLGVVTTVLLIYDLHIYNLSRRFKILYWAGLKRIYRSTWTGIDTFYHIIPYRHLYISLLPLSVVLSACGPYTYYLAISTHPGHEQRSLPWSVDSLGPRIFDR